MPKPYAYVVKDNSGATVQTGAINLSAGQSVTITVSGNATSYSLSSPDDASLSASADMTPCLPTTTNHPTLIVSGACTAGVGTATFIVRNNGATDMTSAYPFTVVDDSGSVVRSGSIFLRAGQSMAITVSGSSAKYTFSSTSDSALTTVVDTSSCGSTTTTGLIANGVCVYGGGAVAEFNIANTGADMAAPYNYEIKDRDGNVVQSGTVQLKAGETLNIKIKGKYDSLTLTILDGAGKTVLTSTASCVESLVVAPAAPSVCIECLVFHTFRDNNLEIYRLDGIEGQPGFKLYNLSKSGAVDSRPSRAPNDSWVAFQSDRNGNVELYYTDLLGSGEPIRLTYTKSNNTNPMYGPDARTIVFQSDRNGRSDLFTVDQNTGKEIQLTSSSADDSNPFFSPDIKKLVFQSNRNGNWDLFVLDLETGTETQLTNTPQNEVFPAWSPNGKQIAFMVNDKGATDLYVLDLETGEQQRLTTDGKTTNAVWSPEGDRIAYQSERDGNLDIYSYDFRNDKEYRVTDYEGVDSGPTWDCGGTNLAFTSERDGDLNVFQVFWQGGSAGNMTIDPASDKWSQWRPSNDISSTGY